MEKCISRDSQQQILPEKKQNFSPVFPTFLVYTLLRIYCVLNTWLYCVYKKWYLL